MRPGNVENEHIVASFPARLRTPPLALRNVVHGGRRTLAAISGVAFSLTMVLLQLGFLEAVKITAANNFEQVDFDIVLLSPRYEQFYAAGFLSPRPAEAGAVAGNRDLGSAACTRRSTSGDAPRTRWISPTPNRPPRRRPARSSAGSRGRSLPRPLLRRELFVMGIDLDKNPFREPIRGRIEAFEPMLRLKHRILLNELSHPDFGWQIRDLVKHWELGNQAVTLVGGFPMLRGFAADATVICSDQNFCQPLPLSHAPADQLWFSQSSRGHGRGDGAATEDVAAARRRALSRGRRSWTARSTTGSTRRRPASSSRSACWSR